MPSPSQLVVEQWLMQLCRLISGIQSAVFVEKNAVDDKWRSLVRWPDNEEPEKDLLKLIRKSIETRRKLIVSVGKHNVKGADLMALPLITGGEAKGAVALCLSARSAQKQKAAIQALQCSLGWLQLLQEQASLSHTVGGEWVERLSGGALSPLSIVDLFADQFHCDRVTLALGDMRKLDIVATSPAVEIKHETGLLRAIKEAMLEALDQRTLLYYPATNSSTNMLLQSHESLAEAVGQVTLCTIPLSAADTVVGALLLERHQQQPFTQREQRLCQQAAGLLGLLLQQRQSCDRPLLRLIGDRMRQRLQSLLGPQGLWLKLGLPALASILLISGLVEGDYHIEARANLEGRIQRVITAPFDGYLHAASARAGDIVEEGAVLCQLDDKELQLEEAKWQTELAKIKREQREALATHERSRSAILQARAEQARAELDRVEMKLERSRIKAPLQGVIVSGDLSQNLGAPLKRGEELFKIAPLESYRVMLQVDEAAIGAVEIGQVGELRLAGYPHRVYPFHVKRILPLSTAVEGSYLFTLEADLEQVSDELRPGLQGVAKVDAGKRSLLWLAGHRLYDRLRLLLWRWWG